MNDKFDVYNNTANDIVIQSVTVPASSYVSVTAADVKDWCQDPLFAINVINSNLGISVYGTDLAYGLGSAADIWVTRVGNGTIVYS